MVLVFWVMFWGIGFVRVGFREVWCFVCIFLVRGGLFLDFRLLCFLLTFVSGWFWIIWYFRITSLVLWWFGFLDDLC